MKTHSPLIILALWLMALALSSVILYSCDKENIPPVRDCPHNDRDTTTNLPDTTSQL